MKQSFGHVSVDLLFDDSSTQNPEQKKVKLEIVYQVVNYETRFWEVDHGGLGQIIKWDKIEMWNHNEEWKCGECEECTITLFHLLRHMEMHFFIYIDFNLESLH